MKDEKDFVGNVCQGCGQAIVCRLGDWDTVFVIHRGLCTPMGVAEAYSLGCKNLERLETMGLTKA